MAEEETLLRTVYSYPVLWFNYRGSDRRARVWRDAAASIGLSVVECKLKKEEGVQNLHYWPHRESLSILDARLRERKREAEDPDSSEEHKPMETQPPAVETELRRNRERAFDEDELFLLSYVPALKRLTPQKRAEVKMQIQQIMFDAEFKEQ